MGDRHLQPVVLASLQAQQCLRQVGAEGDLSFVVQAYQPLQAELHVDAVQPGDAGDVGRVLDAAVDGLAGAAVDQDRVVIVQDFDDGGRKGVVARHGAAAHQGAPLDEGLEDAPDLVSVAHQVLLLILVPDRLGQGGVGGLGHTVGVGQQARRKASQTVSACVA